MKTHQNNCCLFYKMEKILNAFWS